MAKTFHLTIATVGENLFSGEARSVALPGSEGVFTVLPGHEAYVTDLSEGMAYIEDGEGAKHEVRIPEGGVAEISNNQATVLL